MAEQRFKAVSLREHVIEFTEGDPFFGVRVVCEGDLSVDDYLVFTGAELGTRIQIFGNKLLKSWNLDDADGKALPASEEGFRKLPVDLALALITGWTVRSAGVPVPLDGTSSGGKPAAAASIPMAPLSPPSNPRRSRRRSS